MSAGSPRRLRVHGARLLTGGGELPDPVGNACRVWAARRGVVLAVDVGDGVVGLGEASPLPGWSRDDLGSAAAALALATRSLEGATIDVEPASDPAAAAPADRGPVLDVLDAVDAWIEHVLGGAPPSARFAIETALLDALGRVRGQPMAATLGADVAAVVEVSALLGDPGAAGAVERARALIAAGARALKLKLGTRAVVDDVAAVALVREGIGPDVALLADANGAWTIDEARRVAEGLARLGVSVIEQPVAPEHLAALGPLPVAIWADEALTDPATRAEVLALPHLGGVALKPTLLGGLGAARSIARGAAARGLGVAITHALEGPIALRACAALAVALAPVAPRAGLWAHAALDAWPEVSRGARAAAWAAGGGPGLGLAPEERARLAALPRWAG